MSTPPISLPTLVQRESTRLFECPFRRSGMPGRCGLIDVEAKALIPMPIDECDGCFKLGREGEKAAAYRAEFLADYREASPANVAGGCCSGVKRLFARSPAPFWEHLQQAALKKGFTLTPEALLNSKGQKVGCPDEIHVFTVIGEPWVRWSDRSNPAYASLDLSTYFDRVVVISLKRRPDRLTRFLANFTPDQWPFKAPEVFKAVDGSLCPPPRNFTAGGGAWGCMQSHRQILEQAIADGVKRLLVLEDDAVLTPDFRKNVHDFLTAVRPDWDQLMLGGQHINVQRDPPPTVSPGVVRCLNCQRTHAYALQGEFMRELYRAWQAGTTHCDHIMGPLQRHRKVYAPSTMLIGQEEGKSDISGRTNPRTFWRSPTGERPVALIVNNPPPGSLTAASVGGFHRGFTLTQQGVDVTLEKAITSPKAQTRESLKKWLSFVDWESAQYDNWVPTIYHPLWKQREGEIREVLGDRLVEIEWVPGLTTNGLMKTESNNG